MFDIKGKLSALYKRIQKSNFLKSVLTLSAGTVISQAVSLFTTPIISRIYTPDIIGDMSIIISYSSIFGVIICLGLMSAIMIPKEDDEAKGICRLLVKCILVLSTAILLIVILISCKWKLFNVSISYLVACAILWGHIVLVNTSSVCYAYTNRQKLYKVLFWNPTIGTITNAVISISLGLLHYGLMGFAIGHLVSSLLVLIHMLLHVNPFAGHISQEYSVIKVIKKHRAFPIYQLPANIISTFSGQMPIQMIGSFFGSVVLGSYSMCMTILGIPSKFLSAPVNRVYFQEASSRFNMGQDIGEFTFRILITNIKMAIVPLSVLIVFGKPLFEFVLGDNWSQAGSFTAILGVYQLILFCNSCLSGNYVIIGKQKLNLLFAAANIILTVFAFVFGVKVFDNVYSVLILYCIAGSICSLFDMGLFLHYTGVKTSRFLHFIFLYIAIPAGLSVSIHLLLNTIKVL